jgi:hypothetical protein
MPTNKKTPPNLIAQRAYGRWSRVFRDFDTNAMIPQTIPAMAPR